jgi:hypothetical protein
LASVATSGKYSDLSGVPTSLPASDVYSWAKKSSLALADVPDLSSKYAAVGLAGTSRYLEIPNGGYIFTRGGVDWNITNGDWSANYKILHEGNYADTADKRYLQLSGGTVTNNSSDILTVKREGDGNPYITFYSNSAFLGRYGFNTSGEPIAIVNSALRTLIHSGNIGSYNAGSATKLQTARTIWGQSFDGTGNVAGDLDMRYSKITFGESANDYHIGWGSGNMLVYKNYYGHYFITNDTERMRINQSGNVLIGTTTDNGSKLQVNGAMEATELVIPTAPPINPQAGKHYLYLA